MEGHISPHDQGPENVPFQCSICSKTFGKIQHLKRHKATHVDEKLNVCQFCSSEFKRSDALRRHWTTCASRLESGHQVPQRSQSGKRKHACDRCTERKRACNQGNPCAECALQDSECTYMQKKRRYSQPSTSTAKSHGDDVVDLQPSTSQNRSQQLMDGVGVAGRCRFNFLLKFTRALGINQGYNCNRLFMMDASHEHIAPEDAASRASSASPNPWSYFMEEICSGLNGGRGPLSRLNSPEKADLVNDALRLQSSRIWNMLLPFCGEDMGCTATKADIISFFSPENILHFVDIFWDRWYPHCPIFHKPTFEIETCSSLLLMNMVLMGGCTSLSQADCHIAKSLLDIAEELVFSQPIFSAANGAAGKGAHGGGTTDQDHLAHLRTLQATYLICIMQKWEGSNESKVRIQRDQFTKFVSATRAMGLSRARHKYEPVGLNLDNTEWRAWIQREEVNRIFNYVFLLDSAFVIFHNSFPRMVLQEMQIDLTSPEAWFQASSPAGFQSTVQVNPGLKDRHLSLVDCVRKLCNNDSNQNTEFLDGASKLNLFTIATAIHGLIFHQKSSLYTLPLSENPLGKALDRWDIAWDSNKRRETHIQVSSGTNVLEEHDGFMQYADEFAVLARISLELSYFSPTEWTELLDGLSEGSSGAFATFDQAGMGPVGDLMLAVENLSLSK